MIALELQALSQRRENLLVEIGRVVVASGFTLQRQRLAEDRNGVLLTMVVRGPARSQRALAAAMDAHDRIISFTLSAFEEGVQKPHFAASRIIAYEPDAPVPAPAIEPAVAPIRVPDMPQAIRAAAPHEPDHQDDTDADFMFVAAQAPSPQPAAAQVIPPLEPFVELMALGPDIAAVDKLLPKLIDDYPAIFPRLQKLEHSVAEAARASSLLLAGQRVGASLYARDYHLDVQLELLDAIERVGVPALGALVSVDRQGEQLHIRDSPICAENGRSGCVFFSGFLEGVLAPATCSNSVSIFSVCCRSFGAGECILAVSD
jgi:hypothetical protein